jgi:membrane-associated phospholipid phosphatase
MENPPDLKRLALLFGLWTLSLLACAAVVALLFVSLDVPAALHFWKVGRALKPLNTPFGAAVVLSAELVVILVAAVLRIVRGYLSPFAGKLALACLTSICAYGINSHLLKEFFGVATPAEVVHGARHGFSLWMGTENSSFPSGHMALAGAFAGVFMRLNRASVWPLSALLLLAAGLLLVGDWHFASDLVAGTFFGVSAGLIVGEAWAWSTSSNPQPRQVPAGR